MFVKTVKSKITISVVVFSILFTAIVSIFLYINYKKILIRNMVEVTDVNLRLVMDSLDEDFKQVQSIIDWGRINSNLADILERDNLDNKDARETIDFVKLISSMVNSSTVSNSIKKVIISGMNGQFLQMGSIYGHYSDLEKCTANEWFHRLYNDKNLLWTGLVDNEFKYGNSKYIIPIVRPVYSYLEHKNIGFIMIALDSDLVYNFLKKYISYEDSYVMILNSSGQIVAHSDKDYIGQYMDNFSLMKEKAGSASKGSFTIKEENKNVTSVFYKSPLTGWYILQNLSELQVKSQQSIISRLIGIITICIITLGLFLSLLLGAFINKPITRIYKKIRDISMGDFSNAKEIESDDEIGRIGIGINQMSQDIMELLENRINTEKIKKELEFRVLQTQVNPHFLYNTLNSIKWMATIQKASGIGEMSTALSRLLRNIAKNTSSEIKIMDEISFIQDYIIIQQYRYGDSFKVEYDIREEVYQYKILKFTLQPLIENAIFHGIEPKQIKGIIQITIIEVHDYLEIVVRDNGIGMNEVQIQQIMSGKMEHSKDSLNGIGISNVNDRIKLCYGEEYGITISSKVSEYTEIRIRIPQIKDEG